MYTRMTTVVPVVKTCVRNSKQPARKFWQGGPQHENKAKRFFDGGATPMCSQWQGGVTGRTGVRGTFDNVGGPMNAGFFGRNQQEIMMGPEYFAGTDGPTWSNNDRNFFGRGSPTMEDRGFGRGPMGSWEWGGRGPMAQSSFNGTEGPGGNFGKFPWGERGPQRGEDQGCRGFGGPWAEGFSECSPRAGRGHPMNNFGPRFFQEGNHPLGGSGPFQTGGRRGFAGMESPMNQFQGNTFPGREASRMGGPMDTFNRGFPPMHQGGFPTGEMANFRWNNCSNSRESHTRTMENRERSFFGDNPLPVVTPRAMIIENSTGFLNSSYSITIDAQGIKSGDLKIGFRNGMINVAAFKTYTTQDGTTINEMVVREYKLPVNVDESSLKSFLRDDGLLAVEGQLIKKTDQPEIPSGPPVDPPETNKEEN